MAEDPKGPCTQNSIYFGLKVVPVLVLLGPKSVLFGYMDMDPLGVVRTPTRLSKGFMSC